MGTAFLMGGAGGTGGHKVKTEIISTSGTWTVPANVTRLYLWMCGGGSSGAYWNNSASTYGTGIGGLSSMPREYIVNVTPGQVFNVVIGAGGGSVGGDTSFGSYTAKGAYIAKDSGTDAAFIYGNASGGYNTRVSFYVGAGENGNAGSFDDRGSSPSKGYCWLTDDIYCGGGCFYGTFNTGGTGSSASWDSSPTTPAIGGGSALPQIYHSYTTVYSFSYTGNITPASKYGAGGVTVWAYNNPGFYGDFVNPVKMAGYQGVVIIGY